MPEPGFRLTGAVEPLVMIVMRHVVRVMTCSYRAVCLRAGGRVASALTLTSSQTDEVFALGPSV